MKKKTTSDLSWAVASNNRQMNWHNGERFWNTAKECNHSIKNPESNQVKYTIPALVQDQLGFEPSSSSPRQLDCYQALSQILVAPFQAKDELLLQNKEQDLLQT